MRHLINIAALTATFVLSACNSYLDVVPDNVATIDNAFSMRANAEKYLFTCYSYMPDDGSFHTNPAIYGSDEIWTYQDGNEGIQIAKGSQSVVEPIMNYWSFGNNSLYRGIRDCNIFLENISKVKDMDQFERDRWSAEVKVLKAYYHFYLMRMYGPVPLIRENLPISSGIEEVQAPRSPFDECVDYVVELLDEAAAEDDLPLFIQDRAIEMGRITRPVVLALKAKVLLTAASPLFNGNPDFAGFANKDGALLFNSDYNAGKWERAAAACREAIALCHEAGHELYTYGLDVNSSQVSPETYLKMSIRKCFTERWNPEIIWGDPQVSTTLLQQWCMARLDASGNGSSTTGSGVAPTLETAEMFYTRNGVPINEDKTWDYEGRYELRTATSGDQYYIRPNYQTAALHFDRESRFYACLGFDGAVWYGQGRLNEADPWYVMAKLGQYSGGQQGLSKISITGYWPKKLVNPESTYSPTAGFSVVNYPWPLIRLADLYLMYAEALNEVSGPGPEVYEYLNLVRERAGLGTVEASWSQYSTQPSKYQSQDGLREIIRHERGIEFALESSRFWDLRRWRTAVMEQNEPVRGWDISQSEEEYYYQPRVIYYQQFKLRDYFWPIKELDLIVNKNLVQSPGW